MTEKKSLAFAFTVLSFIMICSPHVVAALWLSASTAPVGKKSSHNAEMSAAT
jgi:hypothetical protein